LAFYARRNKLHRDGICQTSILRRRVGIIAPHSVIIFYYYYTLLEANEIENRTIGRYKIITFIAEVLVYRADAAIAILTTFLGGVFLA